MYSDLIISSLVMLCLDASYISFIKDEYLQQIEDIQGTKPKVNMIGVVIHRPKRKMRQTNLKI